VDYPKSVPSVGLVNGKFVDENPVNGTPGSLIPSSWGNAVTDEILSVIRSTNAVPTESNNAQLTDAIVSIADLRASQAIAKAVVPAAESVSGVAKVATQVQTNSGVDDTTIVTPKKMAGAVQGQALVAFTTGGTAPLFTLAPVPAITAYTVNQRFQVKFHSAGAGSDKMNISGLGVKNIMQYDVSGNKVAAVIQGQLTDAVYDGTDIVLLDQLPSAFGVTPSQFDNSTRLATTAFVQGVGLQFSSVVAIGVNTALTVAHAGALIIGSSAAAFNVSLPSTSSVPLRTVIKLWNYGVGTMSLICAGAENLAIPYSVAAYSVQTGASITLVSGNGIWYAVDMPSIGRCQTWQNVTANRVSGTIYTNTSGNPIMVSVSVSGQPYQVFSMGINGITVATSNSGGVNYSQIGCVSIIVPAGSNYVANVNTGSIATWFELR